MANSNSKWVPLEANPETFNAWSRPLGLPSDLEFRDLWSLDADMLQFTPQPVYAVLLLFPARGKLQEYRRKQAEEGKRQWKDAASSEKPVWWIKQTIGNACGSIGLLHSLLNLPSSLVSAHSALSKFYTESFPLSGTERAKLLDETSFFEEAHQAAAQSGQSKVPVTDDELDVDLHFISFVQASGEDGKPHVVELDGGSGRSGPFDWGVLSDPSGDFLQSTAKIIQEEYIDRADGDVNFTIVTLGKKGEDED